MKVARVATDAALGRTFDYEVPEAFAARVQPGTLVRISFGNRELDGFVMELSDATAYAGTLKPILGVADGEPLVSPALLRLAKWMAAYYLAPLERCLKFMFPPDVRGGVLSDGFKRQLTVRAAPAQGRLLEPAPKDREVLERLGDGTELLAGFCRAWHFSAARLRRMARDGLVVIEEKIARRNPLAGRTILRTSPLPLTEEQRTALELIRGELAHCAALHPDGTAASPAPKPVLLHGVTASGKTEVFLQAIAEVLSKGGGAIVLVPEISLTPQTIRRFVSRFGDTVAVLHSNLSTGERHDEWQRIRSGEARVAVGPRSALFAPVARLGLIVVDEEQEFSYKQEDSPPRYQGRDVAVMRAHLEGCAIVLASATPSLESWHNAQTGKYLLSTLRHRAAAQEMPHTVLADMRAETARAGGRRPLFSDVLIQEIHRCLDAGEQVMLFLNRRGYAPTISCPACGYTETCENCSVSMTYHRDDQVLRCHLCGAYRPKPKVCPQCGSDQYRESGFGTQRVETIAQRLFPSARIERMDLDVTTRKASHEEILGRFRAGQTDILIGTQMIAKGLDFPNVTLAGILNADISLSVPDFRASERTFQLIAQMAGRVGRGVKPGTVIVQTATPEAPAIELARTENFVAFAQEELQQRAALHYPPYTHFICVTFKGGDAEQTRQYAEAFAKVIGPGGDAFVVGEPGPASIEKAKGLYLYQMTLRGESPRLLLTRLRTAMAACPVPHGLSVAIDVDALTVP